MKLILIILLLCATSFADTPPPQLRWGLITGTLSNQLDLASALAGKEPLITAGTSLQYWRGDKSFQTLNTSVVPELTNLYFTNARVQALAANPALSNLSTTSINAALLPSSNLGRNLGSASLRWNALYAGILFDGSNTAFISTTGRSILDSSTNSVLNFATTSTAMISSGASLGFTASSGGTLSIQSPNAYGSYSIILPNAQGTGALTNNGSGNLSWNPAASGSVTSVGLSDSTGLFNISGSPVTTSGTLSLSSYASQISHGVLIGPISGGPGAPTWRTFANADATGLTTLINLALPTNQLTGSGNLTDVGTDGITVTGGSSSVVNAGVTLSQHVSDATHNGYLADSDWTTFNNKLDKSESNYITNPDAETNTVGWNLYNDSGRTVPASATNQDITYTSALSGGGGNGATISYTFCGSSYVGPIVTCPTGTSVQVCWYNGPTLADNPTATVLKAAYDAQSCATAIATSAITGTASRLQYINGASTLNGGGDSSPVDGTGGSVTGVTFTRNTSTPLVGIASFDLGKDASSREGSGVSTDFVINSIDKDTTLQISFIYQASSGMVLGSSSDAQVFVYDIGNSVLIPVTPVRTLAGPVSTAKEFVGTFNSTSSSNYRLIVHIATASTTAWDLLLDSVTVNDEVTPGVATQVPSVVLLEQPISGSVTDHMVVMWTDGATQWVPATQASGVNPITQLGFATNITGSLASIYIRGFMDGFSFGPFLGFNQYIDVTAGNISPLPSPFTDTYVGVGKAISTTALNIDFYRHSDLITAKGNTLVFNAANDGSGDLNLSPGANGTFYMANSAAASGLSWTAPVATAPLVYTSSTHTFSCNVANGSVAGCLAAADFTTFNGKASLASPTFTGTPTLPTGTIAVTQTAGNSTTAIATTAFATTADNLKANLASPTFTGTPTLPTGSIGITQAAGNSTTALATTAFVTTADNLKAPLASPTFTGDVNSSTGNVLVSTIGKGLQVKIGTNAKIGQAVLVGGTKTVANTSVTANSRIFLSVSVTGGTPSTLSYTKVAGTSFTITSANVLDTSTIDWFIVESIP